MEQGPVVAMEGQKLIKHGQWDFALHIPDD